jgi:hypothetical protein
LYIDRRCEDVSVAFAQSEQEDRYPWLSWAMTGVLTLAGMLVIGLVISVRNAPPQAGTQARLSQDAPPPSVKSVSSAASPARRPASSAANGVTPAKPRVAATPPPIVAEPAPPGEVEAMPPKIVPHKAPLAVAAVPAAPPEPSAAPAVKADPPLTPPPSSPPPSASETHAAAAPRSQPKQLAAPPDAAKSANYKKAVADVRRLMAARNIAASKQRLKVAADNAQSPAENAEVERLDTIQDHLEQFWDGIRDAVAAMQPTNEIVLSEVERVAVIEASRKELAVQMYGRQRRYRIEALPMDLLSAIAKSSFKLTPGTKLVVGSFLAMDTYGNRTEARKFWREAIAGGENDGKLLLPELDVPPAKSK